MRQPIQRAIVGQVDRIGAVGIHNIDFIVAIAVGIEQDLGAIGRPCRIAIAGGVIGQVDLPRSVLRHAIDLVIAIAVGIEEDILLANRGLWCRHLLW